MELEAKHCYSAQSKHGEGPVWYDGALWWVDIIGSKLNRYQIGAAESVTYSLEFRPGAAVPCSDGNWLIGDEQGLSLLDPKSGTARSILRFLDDERVRMNDGKCDADGRFWVGSIHEDLKVGQASLYRFDGHDRLSVQLEAVTISNGLDWSEDGTLFYYIDTPRSKIEIFDFDRRWGQLSNRRTLVDIPVSEGYPDGMCIDREGHLWVALWEGSAVQRYHGQTGEVLARVELPVTQPSSCCFGGENLDQLFITTSQQGFSETDLAKEPLAGDLFAVVAGVRGYDTRKFVI